MDDNDPNDPAQQSTSQTTSKTEVQKPLKFKVNPQTGNVEDAEGSYLIQDYRSCVGNVYEGYGLLRDNAQKELKEVETALGQMAKDSDEYFATQIYKNKLVNKIEKIKKKASDLIELELFLSKVLAEIYKATLSLSEGYFVSLSVPNYEILSQRKFCEIEKLDFYYHHNSPEKNLFELKIPHQLSSFDLNGEFYLKLGSSPNSNKLQNTQKEIFKKAKLIYHCAAKTEHDLNFQEIFELKTYQQVAQANQKTVIQLLKEHIDDLIFKAEKVYIPQMAPPYKFAKIVMTFCEEVERHRPAKQGQQ